MALQLSIDRFEGDHKEIAVLLTDDGVTINVPKSLLPKGAKAGEVLSVTFTRDQEATRKIAEETKQVQKDLEQTDPGGDIKI
jgi:hypothetical protein